MHPPFNASCNVVFCNSSRLKKLNMPAKMFLQPIRLTKVKGVSAAFGLKQDLWLFDDLVSEKSETMSLYLLY